MVRTRYERLAASLLERKGYESFVPTYSARRARGDRQRKTEIILFPGYVFCRFAAEKKLPILITPGVKAVVGTSQGPLEVREDEIAALQLVMQHRLPCQPWPWARPGQWVRVTRGTLEGIYGEIVKVIDGYRLILSVSALHRSVAVHVDGDSVSPITEPHPIRPQEAESQRGEATKYTVSFVSSDDG